MLPCLSWAQSESKYQVVAQAGGYSFQVDNPQAASSSSTISGFGAYNLHAGMGFKTQFLAFFGMSLLASDGIGGDLATGFDLGLRYYPWTSYGSRYIESEDVLVRVKHHFRPYFGVAAREREFFTTLSSHYVGAGVLGGIDLDISPRWYVNAEARFDFLMGQGEASATQLNALGGIGFHF